MLDSSAGGRRIAVNSIYGLLAWLLPVLITFITTPILFRSLGAEQYGIYALVLSFTTYFFTVGIGRTAAKFVAEYRAENDLEKISRTISATLYMAVGLTIVAASLSALLANTVVTDLLSISGEHRSAALVAFYLSCLNVVPLAGMQTLFAVLQGLQSFRAFLVISVAGTILNTVGLIMLALSGAALIYIFAWMTICTAGISIAAYLRIRRELPAYRFSFSAGMGRGLWLYALSIIGYQAFGSVLYLFERGWVTRLFGPETLAYYAIAMMLAIYIHLFSANVIAALFPTFNERLSDLAGMRSLYKKAVKIVAVVATLGALVAMSCGQPLLTLWLSHEVSQRAYPLLVIHGLTFAILGLNTVAWLVAESFGYAKVNALTTAAWMIVSVPLMISLADRGPYGVAIGRLLGVIVFIPMILYVERRLLRASMETFWALTMARALVSAATAYGSVMIFINYVPEGSLSLLGSLVLCVAIYGAVLSITGMFDADDKRLFMSVIRRPRTVQS